MGLKIMRYRANAIGAELRIARSATGGTVVTCVLPPA
jgi:nitrate/nitrite-specific signal transduction histidine kinase